MDEQITISPYFIETIHGKIFVIEYIPRMPNHKTETVIIVPPFAEEMNRSRRMMSLQARGLAGNGVRAIIVDLYGTGDSAGEFSDARWSFWCDSILSVLSSLDEASRGSISFLAIRFGALVLFDPKSELISRARKIVLWSPCTNGLTFLRQFLRIRIASQMSENNSNRESITELMERFAAGESVEVAGYEISAELARSIESATLNVGKLEKRPSVYWFELVSTPDNALPVASNAVIEQMRRDNIEVSVSPICGERYWSSVEITTVPRLIDATTAVFIGA